MATQQVREGFHTVTPYLMSPEAEALIEFVKNVFGATETFRTIGSAGGIHCEVLIGDSMIMIGGGKSVQGGEKSAALYLYIPDVDAVYRRALEAGATSVQPPSDTDDGDRRAWVNDPFGNIWFIASPVAGA